jgi:hypothetical protein
MTRNDDAQAHTMHQLTYLTSSHILESPLQHLGLRLLNHGDDIRFYTAQERDDFTNKKEHGHYLEQREEDLVYTHISFDSIICI